MEHSCEHVYFQPLAGTCPHCVRGVAVTHLDAEGRSRCGFCHERFYAEDVSARVSTTPEGLVLVDGNMLVAYRGVARVLHLPERVTMLADCCLAGNRTLEGIAMPGVRHVGRAALRRCTALRQVVFGDQLVTLAPCAFDGCLLLSQVNMPRNLESVGSRAFRGCPLPHDMPLPPGCRVATDAFPSE